MKFPEHGANPKQLAEEIGSIYKEKMVDFSTNTSVVSHPLVSELSVCGIDTGEYPDPQQQRMKEILSRLYGLTGENFLVTNGANEAIYLIASYCVGKKIGIIVPTYPEYEKALLAYGAEVVFIMVNELDEALDNREHSLWRDMENLDMLFLCNPNNPTGTYYDEETLSPLVQWMSSRHLTLVVDESYIDFVLTKHVDIFASQRWDLEKTIVLRSLTKNFQLASIRVAYVVSGAYWIGQMTRRQPTWSVNGMALNIAERIVADAAFLKKMRLYYQKEVHRFRQRLIDYGLHVMNTDVHFFLIKTEDDIGCIQMLLEQGIAVRHTRNHRGLDGNYIRIATRTPKENDYFIQVIKERWIHP